MGNYISGTPQTQPKDILAELNLKAGPPPAATQTVYVSKAGNDTTGDGRFLSPFLTIQRAMTEISDASQTKIYSVQVGPGIYNDNFAFKPWVSVVGVASSSAYEGVTQIGSGAVISFDASWSGSVYDVAWFAHLTFNNTPSFDIPNVDAQLTFFTCEFNNGVSFVAHHSGNVNNMTLDNCVSYGNVSVTDCQYLYLVGGTVIYGSGSVTVTSTPAVAPTQTTLLAQGGSIGTEGSPALSFVSQASSGGAVGDMQGCSVTGSLSLSGAMCSYTATADGIPSTRTYSSGATELANLHYYTASGAIAYVPSVLADWSGLAPVSVQHALDRLAAKASPV